MSFRPLGWIFSSDLAVDLGTANTLVYVRGEGIVLNEPSVVAISQSDHSLLAVGHAAKAMLGRAPGSIQVLRPLRHGVIADFDTTERMLQYFITTVRRRRSLVHPRIVLTVPSGITQVEKRAVRDTAQQAGAREVFLIEQAMAAAVGAGLPIQEPGGHMIVDIGGGTTEVAILSLAGIVYSKSVRIAGDEMNESIIQYVRKAYNLLIGERQAEDVKIALGSARPDGGESETWAVKGRDLIDGFPKTVAVSREEIRDALRDPVMAVVGAVQACLEQAPPELAADIADKGIVLTGGGALLTGLATLLHEETDLSIAISAEPLACVAHGAGKLLDHLDLLRRVAIGT
jgi:rod shape-determining protein MreB and related proteins